MALALIWSMVIAYVSANVTDKTGSGCAWILGVAGFLTVWPFTLVVVLGGTILFGYQEFHDRRKRLAKQKKAAERTATQRED